MIFISSGRTLLGDLKVTSSVFFYIKKFYLHSTDYSNVSYHSWLAYFDFLAKLYEKDLYHQQSDPFCSVELSYGDH